MAWLSAFSRDLEHGPRVACPECEGVRVRRRSGSRTGVLTGAIAAALWAVVLAPGILDLFEQRLVATLGAWFGALLFTATSVAAIGSATFGRNRCLACGYEWR